MNIRICWLFAAPLVFLPFFESRVYALDSAAMVDQLAGNGCTYVTEYDRRNDYKYFSSYSDEELGCKRNRGLFKMFFTGTIGCRMHAAYCLYEAQVLSKEALELLHNTLQIQNESYDYAGIRGSDLKVAAVRALGKHRAKESIVPLTSVLSDHKTLQGEILTALRKYGSEARTVFPAVSTTALLHRSYYALWLETLASLDPVRSIPFLEAGLNQDEPNIRKKATELLSAIPSYSKSTSLLLRGMKETTLLREAAENLNARTLKDAEVTNALRAIFTEKIQSDAQREKRIILTEALLTAGPLPEPLCTNIQAQALGTTVYRIFEYSLSLLAKSCKQDKPVREQLIQKLPALPPAMRAKAISFLTSISLSDRERQQLACFKEDLSRAVTKALGNVSLPGTCEATAEVNNYLEKQGTLRALLDRWVRAGKDITAFTVSYSTTFVAPLVRTEDHPFSRSPESGTIVFKVPHQYRNTRKENEDSEKVEIIHGKHEWSVRIPRENGDFGRAYEDWHYSQPLVPAAPLVRKQERGRCHFLSGLPGRYQQGKLTSNLEYVKSFAHGNTRVHHLKTRST